MENPLRGATVDRKSHGGAAEGKAVRKPAEPIAIESIKIMISKENQECGIETGKGKCAVRAPEPRKKL